jgi:oligo-1,6-glucosidase
MNLNEVTGRSMPGWQIEPCDLIELKQVMTRWQCELEGRGSDAVGVVDHDPKRAISRFGNDRFFPE